MRRSGAERYRNLRQEKDKRERAEEAFAHKALPENERSLLAPPGGKKKRTETPLTKRWVRPIKTLARGQISPTEDPHAEALAEGYERQHGEFSEGKEYPKLRSNRKGKKALKPIVKRLKEDRKKEAQKKNANKPKEKKEKLIWPKIARQFHADARQLLAQLQEARSSYANLDYEPEHLRHNPKALAAHRAERDKWKKMEMACKKAITTYNRELRTAVESGAIPEELHEKLLLTPVSGPRRH